MRSLTWVLLATLLFASAPASADDLSAPQTSVRVGNQAPLGTRAAPFATYITAMHRQIHKRFTLGFLSDIDARNDSAYANDNLWTQLEIVIKEDGSVDRVGIVRASGLSAFDTAAIASVTSAAPFPPPPSAIKSADGKVYLDWQFHRDERGCGTFGVDPHILTVAGQKNEHDTTETGTQQPKAQATQSVRRDDPSDPRMATDGWFAAYARRDPAWLAGWSATPFTDGGKVIARDAATLKSFYAQLVATAPTTGARAVTALNVLTPADIRRELGSLPPGGEPSNMLYATAQVGGKRFILLLKKSSQGWRVCGLDR